MEYLRRLALWLIAWSCTSAYGQIYKYITLEDGLSSRNVYAVQQSNGGFMWFLTDNGIDRYDGSEVNTYTLTINGQEFTEYSSMRFVYDREDDNLWMVTGSGKVVRYDKRTNRLEVMYAPLISTNKADMKECAVSPVDYKGNIWIIVGQQAFCYNIRSLEGRPMSLVVPEGKSSSFSAIVAQTDSTLYVGTQSGVYRGRVVDSTIELDTVCGLRQPCNVNTFYYDPSRQILLIGSEDAGIIAYMEHTRKVIHHADLLPDVRVTKIIPFRGGKEVLFSTNAVCVYRMDMDECKPMEYLSGDFTTDYRMNTDNVADIHVDQDGQLWLCSFPHGLTVRNEHYPRFNWIRRSNLSENSLINNSIDCIVEDSQHDLWYATDNGISMYEAKTGKWHTILSSISNETPNLNHYFLALCEVQPGILLAGGYAAGIYVIDKRTKEVQFVRPDLMAPEKYIQTMYLDASDGSVWMGGENQLFNVSYIGKLKVNHAEVFGGINCITQKDENSLWIGTKDGLYCFDKLTREKRRIELPLERFKVNTIYQDLDGTVYVGTHHHGLLVYNEEENYYHRYTKENSALTNNCMKCIVCADNQTLFISAENGIVRFNKNTGRITTWTHDQGLQGINFGIRAGVLTHDHTMMFGGDKGVVEIHTGVHLPHIYKGTLVLSDLYIGNTRVTAGQDGAPIKDALDNLSALKLKDSQRNAAIKVKCINHLYPSDCIVTWTFDTHEEALWLPLNEDRFITLNELHTGRHQLTIRAMSQESGQVLDERVMHVTIKPPFYLSLWGLCIELLLLLLIAYFTYLYIKSANAAHVSDEKINFFINMSHDIRTPLTLVKAPLEELNQSPTLSAEEKEAVELALRNTNALTQITENVMKYELASIEKGIMRIECLEAVSHFQNQIDRIVRLAEAKQQHIVFNHPEEDFSIWVDVRKLNSIIQNLLSNAIKYSDNGETITLCLYCNEKNWGFHVADNGIGISVEEKDKLFKQMFRAANAINATTFGCGIGLMSIYRYVKQMKGHVEVKSALNQGSDFHIRFPRGKTHYDTNATEFVDVSELKDATDFTPIPPQCDNVADDHRHRLLIVEDNPEMLGYLKRIFDKDFIVYTATNGKEAYAKLPYVQPLIVLSDVMMPEMRGDDLCVSIKSNIDTSHIAVVLISALSDQQSIINGLSVKADAYVTKPFDSRILQLTINNLVESRLQLRQQLATLDTTYDNLPDATSELDLKLMAEMKEVIERHLDNNGFTVDTLAYELRVSRTTLYNKVKGLTGNTPSDLIRIYRIGKAKTLLRERRHSVVEIAEMVGFADQKYFREVFKKAVGMTPSEYARGGER